ncbi:MAG TPA: hypothetical protein VHZ73_03400, partial [Vicinamibacterales bacterium]|nr:hypothetical protein [Vicinamibacterales bacterium]
VDDTGGLLSAMEPGLRVAACNEWLRVLRPAGRVMVVGAGSASGISALMGRGSSAPAFDVVPLLDAQGFKAVRILAEREGLIFVEGIKPRTHVI